MEEMCLHPEMIKYLTQLGHTEMFGVSDYRLPVDRSVPRIELAWKKNNPRWLEVCRQVAGLVPIEKIIVANELRERNTAMHMAFVREFGQDKLEYMDHASFKKKTSELRFSIRTGEFSSYCNCIFVVGVEF